MGPLILTVESGVRVGEVLGSAEDALAFGVYFFVRHPRYVRSTRQVVDFLRPGLKVLDFLWREYVAEDEVAVLGEEGVLVLCEGGLGSCGRHYLLRQREKCWTATR